MIEDGRFEKEIGMWLRRILKWGRMGRVVKEVAD